MATTDAAETKAVAATAAEGTPPPIGMQTFEGNSAVGFAAATPPAVADTNATPPSAAKIKGEQAAEMSSAGVTRAAASDTVKEGAAVGFATKPELTPNDAPPVATAKNKSAASAAGANMKAPLTPAPKVAMSKDVTDEVQGLLMKRVLSPLYATPNARDVGRGSGGMDKLRVKNMEQLIQTACLEIYGEVNDTNAQSVQHVLTEKFLFLDSKAAPVPQKKQGSKRMQRELDTAGAAIDMNGRRPARNRKKTELFDASTTSADYSRKLRQEVTVRSPLQSFPLQSCPLQSSPLPLA
jgi:hypothetical protein